MVLRSTTIRWHAAAAGVAWMLAHAGCTGLHDAITADPMLTATTPAGDSGPGGMASSAPTDTFVSPDGLPTGTVSIGQDTFDVEFALTRQTRMRGLMGRRSLDENAGMLFVFDRDQVLSFWMYNTLIPLDIAFIRADLTISSIDTMEPLTTTSHRSIEPVRYALEARAGEFDRRGIGPGDTLSIAGLD